jgi:hypothetical protein
MLVFWRISRRSNGGLAMKKKRFSVEQIVAVLHQAFKLLSYDRSVGEQSYKSLWKLKTY